MSSQLLLDAMSISFKLNRSIWDCPLEFDSHKRRFISTAPTTNDPAAWRKFFRRYWVWLFALYGILVGTTGGSCAYVVFVGVFFPKSKPHITVYHMVPYGMLVIGNKWHFQLLRSDKIENDKYVNRQVYNFNAPRNPESKSNNFLQT